jgi:hypothetical protein
MLPLDPGLTAADIVVLESLSYDLDVSPGCTSDSNDAGVIKALSDLSTPSTVQFEPVVLTSWSVDSIHRHLPPLINSLIVDPYIRWAGSVVRTPSDIIYLSHVLLITIFGLSNAIILFFRFNWIQAVLQYVMLGLFLGPFSIISHHAIHRRWLFSKEYRWLDIYCPYVLGPIMGQTWNSFYYHHKHHHVEDNGPNDLSSTIRYQRDSGLHLAAYLGRFLFLNEVLLPLYYIRTGNISFALNFIVGDYGCFAIYFLLARLNLKATLVVFVIPLILWRIAVMTNNWGQHMFVDDDVPTSSYRSSITLIDVVVRIISITCGVLKTNSFRRTDMV